MAPYIGKLKPSIARELIATYTKAGDVVLDCFAGSGTIPLEAALQDRTAVAIDPNPYAYVLIRAKLDAPLRQETALARLDRMWRFADTLKAPPLAQVPEWVKQFFHPRTLREALKFVEACRLKGDHFLLGGLLGILHHQRPGFLSYPSSHLVPYLRTKLFPRAEYPEMYEYRDVRSRLEAKISRLYRNDHRHRLPTAAHVRRTSIENFCYNGVFDAIITSPPYMNALDYIRDNRLRMYFLDRSVRNYVQEPTDDARSIDDLTRMFANKAFAALKKGGEVRFGRGRNRDPQTPHIAPCRTFCCCLGSEWRAFRGGGCDPRYDP